MALIIFDIIFLPITILRLILIYFFGSKYNVKGMEFLDVMFHASKLYFNQEDNLTIDVLHEDVRATIKRETKLFEETQNEKKIPEEKKEMLTQNIQTEIMFEENSEENKTLEKKPTLKLQKIKEKATISKKIKNNKLLGTIEEETEQDTKNNSDTYNQEETEKSRTEEESDNETENVLDTYTEESNITSETETEHSISESVLKKINKKTNFNLDVHIDKLFDDLENSMTTMTTEMENDTEISKN